MLYTDYLAAVPLLDRKEKAEAFHAQLASCEKAACQIHVMQLGP